MRFTRVALYMLSVTLTLTFCSIFVFNPTPPDFVEHHIDAASSTADEYSSEVLQQPKKQNEVNNGKVGSATVFINSSTSSVVDGPMLVGSDTTTDAPRVAIPLFFTHENPSVFTRTVKTWRKNLFTRQRNVDLLIFFQHGSVNWTTLMPALGAEVVSLAQIPSSSPYYSIARNLHAAATILTSTATTSNDKGDDEPALYGCMHNGTTDTSKACVEREDGFVFFGLASKLGLPRYFDAMSPAEVEARTSGDDRQWMRCGCPPYCPVKRATKNYIQGTRWYSHALFLERNKLLQKLYPYFVKLDTDIWVMKPLPFNIGAWMHHHPRTVVVHTGYTYNGHGCSNNLDASIKSWVANGGRGSSAQSVTTTHGAEDAVQTAELWPVRRSLTAGVKWWEQVDNTFYTNFMVYNTTFFYRPEVLGLNEFLNEEVVDGFFRYRWTDQSLVHKVVGVFEDLQNVSLSERDATARDSVVVDMSCLRFHKERSKPWAIFYHSKRDAFMKKWRWKKQRDIPYSDTLSPCGGRY